MDIFTLCYEYLLEIVFLEKQSHLNLGNTYVTGTYLLHFFHLETHKTQKYNNMQNPNTKIVWGSESSNFYWLFIIKSTLQNSSRPLKTDFILFFDLWSWTGSDTVCI